MECKFVKVTMKIPASLRELCSGASQVGVDATNVAEAIAALDRIHPGMADRICTEQGQPRRHVLIYVNQEDIRELQGLRTPLQEEDEVHIVAAVSGG